ncbi:hypothetical protein SESBI_38352 [Sesbania bispinosa]|nr:hypothetical protein SESBI_38352 [Sesbania bispinosa]
MVCTLAIQNTDLASLRDQILARLSIPTLDEVLSRLLRVASSPHSGLIAADTSALISTNAQHGYREEQGGPYRGGNRTSWPKCTYCHRWGHTKEKCFKLHGRTPRANLAQTNDTLPKQPRDLPMQQFVTLTGTDYDDYLSLLQRPGSGAFLPYCSDAFLLRPSTPFSGHRHISSPRPSSPVRFSGAFLPYCRLFTLFCLCIVSNDRSTVCAAAASDEPSVVCNFSCVADSRAANPPLSPSLR